MKTPLIAGNPLEAFNHNVAGNGERDGLKTESIGQSAAKHPNIFRIEFYADADEGPTTSLRAYPQVRGNGEHPTFEEDGDMVFSASKDVADDEVYVYALLDPRKPGSFSYAELKFNFEPFYIGMGKNK